MVPGFERAGSSVYRPLGGQTHNTCSGRTAMAEAKTVSVKYIFLDVVKYSQGRSVEAQTDIIAALNQLVRGSAKDVAAPQEKIIYLPTGDGICTALFDVDSPYDIHLQLALSLLERLDACNSQTEDPMRNIVDPGFWTRQ